jgi:hypothetical protein
MLMMTCLSLGETGSFFSTSVPPLANMKCPRFVLPPASFAPSAAMRTRSGSDRSGYGNSFCARQGQDFSHSLGCSVVDSCLELPFLLSLGLVVAETVHREIVLRKTRINIAEPARLGRATRCTNNQHDGRFIAPGPKTYRCRPWERRRESRPSPQ